MPNFRVRRAVTFLLALYLCLLQPAVAATLVPNAGSSRFSVTVTGAGPDVLLIPGLASSAATWDATVANLASHYRLHVLQLAGFAGLAAGANASGPILPPTVEALDGYIHDANIKPVVIGHSLGGLLALMLASAHPDDIKSLVIVDALPFGGLLVGPTAKVETIRPQAELFRKMIVEAPAALYDAQEARSIAAMVTSPTDQAKVRAWVAASDRAVVAEGFYEVFMTDIRPDLPKMHVPTLVIYASSPIMQRTAETIDTFYRDAYAGMVSVQFKRIDDARHFIMFDQPAAFQATLDEALK